MKVKTLLEMLSQYSPEDELCVLYWDKEQYDFKFLPEDEDVMLTPEIWEKVCKEFDEWDNAGQEITEWISDAVFENLELKETA